jgi:ADP-ribose pyrophosphatase YjhB (NUDIX family)
VPRHCSGCGGWIGQRAPVSCPTCGTPHWLNASPAAAALVVADGKLLLTRRAIEPWRGMWCAPSGFCDGGEHPAACAVREAQEEAGVHVRIVGYLGHWIDEYSPSGPDGADPEYCGVTYYHAVPEGKVAPRPDATEVAEIAWFAPDELPANVSPPGNGPRIYAAWREAYEAGLLHTPLPDGPY